MEGAGAIGTQGYDMKIGRELVFSVSQATPAEKERDRHKCLGLSTAAGLSPRPCSQVQH